MTRISLPLRELKDSYTVVVIGSGYGGSIAASRLGRAGQSVCVLERGKEWAPGSFPDTAAAALGQLQVSTPDGREGAETGLFDIHLDDDLSVLRGCGLGGTSLINANVALTADRRVFADPCWPQALRDDVDGGLAAGYQRAKEMLKPEPYPEGSPGYPPLAKYLALKKSGERLGRPTYHPPLNVNWTVNGPNHVGMPQKPCVLCGDCVSGCNHQAKNTTAINYLPDACNHGAEIFCEVRVDWIEHHDGRYLVHYAPVGMGREEFRGAPKLFVRADVVVVAAGAIGSTEVLLRSREKGLATSSQVGAHFTGNGDAFGFAFNASAAVGSVGVGTRDPATCKPAAPGPCIVGVIDARSDQEPLGDGYVIEDGTPPGACGEILNRGLLAVATLHGKDTAPSLDHDLERAERALIGQVQGASHGAMHHTQTFLAMANDDAQGHLTLKDGRLRIHWPGVGGQPIFGRLATAMEEATRALEGIFVPNPTWSAQQRKPLLSVHPLGGCVMGESGAHSVVNHKCQVYTGDGAEVYAGLYVADGAVLPRAVGVNPLYTIAAVAERAMGLLAADRGWRIDYTLPSVPRLRAPENGAIGVRFTESMKGYFSHQTDYQTGAAVGAKEDSDFAFVFTITCADVEAMRQDPLHRCSITGTVVAKALGSQPLTTSGGTLELFSQDPDHVDTINMWYRTRLIDAAGQDYWFEGFKVVHDHGSGVREGWPDTTTLYITLWKGKDTTGAVVGKGILRISAADFARQLTTMEAVGGGSPLDRLRALGRFGEFFAGSLFHTYGGIAASSRYFDSDAPARKKRPLRTGTPVVYPLPTADGKTLRLTRYQGGTKGPLLVIHGMGVSSLINTIDTIDTSLTEFFWAHGYDVWLLDWRASIVLPYAQNKWSADVVARYDHPAAVAKVLAITGARSLQVLPHCVGSLTFFMAMLAGLQGVRSIGVSQVSCHPIGGAMVRLKSELHLPSVLGRLGIESMTAYADQHADWSSRLFDKFLKLYPVPFKEHCDSAVCHRISFLYNLLYEHDQLNAATHDALHEMFGSANVEMFEQLALMNRYAELRAQDGADSYLPHYARLKLPIRFVTGAKNITFTPAGNRKTLEWLSAKNGGEYYDLVEVPGYGHIDCLFGKNAVTEVFPIWLEHFEKTATE